MTRGAWGDTRPVYYGNAVERNAFDEAGEAAGALFFDYDDGTWYYWDGAVWIDLTNAGVAGADTQVQFNDGGAFGADADFTWAKATNVLTIGGTNGVDHNPGGDVDADLLSVIVTGSPKLYWDESLDATRWTKPQVIDGALSVTRTVNAFGIFSSNYPAFVVGDVEGANADNGGLYAIARYNKATEPFTGFCGWDNGTVRRLYFGGGNWGVPDATEQRFYTAAAYNETNDAGVLRMIIDTSGRVGIGNNTAPNYTLHVHEASAGAVWMQFTNTDTGTTGNDGFFFGLSAAEEAQIWTEAAMDLGFFPGFARKVTFGADGDVGIGIQDAAGQLHVDQDSGIGAQPVLYLDQADVSEEFVRFVGTAAAATLTQSIVNDADVTSATLQGWLKVYVVDDGNQITDQAYFVPIYTLA